MATMQDIEKRIDSIATTRQIAQAMKLVSNTKIRRARELMEASRPFADEAHALVRSVADALDYREGPLFERDPQGSTLYIVTGSDRGLCGAYNINICKFAYEQIMEATDPYVMTIGVKPQEYFARRGVPIVESYRGISQNPFFLDGRIVGDHALELFFSGRVQRVVLVYSRFESLLSHEPTALPLLPLPTAEGGDRAMELEPAGDELLKALLPTYMQAHIFAALAEGAACEQSARITSMDAAVRNCTDLVDKLQMEYNQARQSAITQELNEIISGAQIL